MTAFNSDHRGTKPGRRNPVPREQRATRSYYLQFKGEDLEAMSAMIADFLDQLDKAGYGDVCQTERCSHLVNYQIVVC